MLKSNPGMLTVNVYGSEIKELLIVGDGLTKNAPLPELGWNSNLGMAATSEEISAKL